MLNITYAKHGKESYRFAPPNYFENSKITLFLQHSFERQTMRKEGMVSVMEAYRRCCLQGRHDIYKNIYIYIFMCLAEEYIIFLYYVENKWQWSKRSRTFCFCASFKVPGIVTSNIFMTTVAICKTWLSSPSTTSSLTSFEPSTTFSELFPTFPFVESTSTGGAIRYPFEGALFIGKEDDPLYLRSGLLLASFTNEKSFDGLIEMSMSSKRGWRPFKNASSTADSHCMRSEKMRDFTICTIRGTSNISLRAFEPVNTS